VASPRYLEKKEFSGSDDNTSLEVQHIDIDRIPRGSTGRIVNNDSGIEIISDDSRHLLRKSSRGSFW
jgi:hypothetical protein